MQIVPLKFRPITVFLFLMPLAIFSSAVLLGLGVSAVWSRAKYPRGIVLLACNILGFFVLLICSGDVREVGSSVSDGTSSYYRYDSSLATIVPYDVRSRIDLFFEAPFRFVVGLFVGLLAIVTVAFSLHKLLKFWHFLKQRYLSLIHI